MENNFQFKLIDGTFAPLEAGKLLSNLIESKLKFHTLEKFSIQIRYDGDVTQSELRMKELREVSQHVSAIVEKADSDQKMIRISGQIDLIIE